MHRDIGTTQHTLFESLQVALKVALTFALKIGLKVALRVVLEVEARIHNVDWTGDGRRESEAC